MLNLRAAEPQDVSRIVELNADVVDVTSPMDAERFDTLRALSAHCVVAEKEGDVVGFVLAMEQGSPYQNGNYSWFADRLNNFVYIDRVVISKDGQGHGLGRLMYAHVSDAARANGCTVICAEMDLDPPNEQSLGFHEKLGFVRLGTRQLDSGKIVSMQVRNL